MTELYLKRVAEYGLEDTVLLLAYKKYEIGVNEMNKHLQKVEKPQSEDKHEVTVGGTIYRVGDPVMYVKCNTPDVSTGDTGIILDIVKVIDIVNGSEGIKVTVVIKNKLSHMIVQHSLI